MGEKRKDFDKTLGNSLKELREKSDYNQSDIAEKLNVTQANVSLYEKGTRLPSMNVLYKYSTLFNCDFNKLIESRIETIKKTAKLLREDTPLHIQDEYTLISYYESIIK